MVTVSIEYTILFIIVFYIFIVFINTGFIAFTHNCLTGKLYFLAVSSYERYHRLVTVAVVAVYPDKLNALRNIYCSIGIIVAVFLECNAKTVLFVHELRCNCHAVIGHFKGHFTVLIPEGIGNIYLVALRVSHCYLIEHLAGISICCNGNYLIKLCAGNACSDSAVITLFAGNIKGLIRVKQGYLKIKTLAWLIAV